MAKKSIRCKHRHIVFTMSDKLWLYFQKYRYLLNGLFEASSNAILSWFYELNKSQNFKPGNISSIKQTIDYVVRYTGRPAMAQSRILNYNGEYVTFWYDRHDDGKRVEETVLYKKIN